MKKFLPILAIVLFCISPVFSSDFTFSISPKISYKSGMMNEYVFVYDDNGVLGYVFCQISRTQNTQLFHDIKTLYIDDICVDENARGRHVGKALFDYVKNYAQSIGCHNVTLNVWSGNDTALSFYQNMGMTVQKTTMELVF